jgi:hypothetical protein
MSIPVTPDAIKKYNVTDSSVISTGRMNWLMKNTAQYGNVKVVRTQDLIVLDIIMQAKWQRPVYFAVTCSDDSRIGLDDYLLMEGMALKVVPKKSPYRMTDFINEPVLRKQLLKEPAGFSKTYQPGFKYRGLNDSTMFFDENHVRLTQNYRNAYMRLAIHYIYQERSDKKAIEVLDAMEQKIPRKVIPMDYRIKHDVAKLYFNANAGNQYRILAQEVIATAKEQVKANPRSFANYYNPYEILLTHYENLKMYKDAIELLNQLELMVPGDESIKQIKRKFVQLAGMDSLETVQR